MADELEALPTQAPTRGAASARASVLIVANDSSVLRRLPLRGTVVIGRAPECEIQLSDVASSRRHAALASVDGVVTVRDLGSQNGTLVNGERIHGPRVLVSGDAVAIGDTTLGTSTWSNPYDHALMDRSYTREWTGASGRYDTVTNVCGGSFAFCAPYVSDHAPIGVLFNATLADDD